MNVEKALRRTFAGSFVVLYFWPWLTHSGTNSHTHYFAYKPAANNPKSKQILYVWMVNALRYLCVRRLSSFFSSSSSCWLVFVIANPRASGGVWLLLRNEFYAHCADTLPRSAKSYRAPLTHTDGKFNSYIVLYLYYDVGIRRICQLVILYIRFIYLERTFFFIHYTCLRWSSFPKIGAVANQQFEEE